MSLLAKLERRFGAWAIPNVTLLIIVGQIAVFVLDEVQRVANPGGNSLIGNMYLVGSLVLAGEVWRVFTFPFVPPAPGSSGLIACLFAWLVFYLVGTAMEHTWGVFRYNAYLFIGYLATVAVAFAQPAIPATNWFYFASVFLAFARLYPDFIFNLFLILPIKVKWLALIQWIVYGLFLLSPDSRLMVVAAVANYFAFFWKEHYRDIKDHHRRTVFRAKAAPGGKSERIVHTCAVCGLSSADEPRTSFRYCSQCDGQRCYCPEHIRDHEHVVERSAKE